MTTPITDSNSDGLLTVIETALHGLVHDVAGLRADMAAVRADVTAMRSAWTDYEPVVAAFRRGGWLAARSAAKRGSNGRPDVQ